MKEKYTHTHVYIYIYKLNPLWGGDKELIQPPERLQVLVLSGSE